MTSVWADRLDKWWDPDQDRYKRPQKRYRTCFTLRCLLCGHAPYRAHGEKWDRCRHSGRLI